MFLIITHEIIFKPEINLTALVISSCLIFVEKCKNPWQYYSSRYSNSNKISEVTNKQYGAKSIHTYQDIPFWLLKHILLFFPVHAACSSVDGSGAMLQAGRSRF
jgi:hypothetical protein